MDSEKQSRQFTVPRPRAGIIGHRGVAGLAPENTLAGFRLASKLGIECIEFDVRLTKDNQLVIFHDDTLERTTNGQGIVESETYSDLSLLDAGTWFHSQFANERIPLFEIALSDLLHLPLSLNIELKLPASPSFHLVQMMAKRFVHILGTRWPSARAWPLVSSFHWPILSLVRLHFPFIPLGFLTENCTEESIYHVAQIPNSAIHTDYASLTPALLSLAKQLEVPVLAYTVNEAPIASQLLNDRVFAIFSDMPLFMLPSPP